MLFVGDVMKALPIQFDLGLGLKWRLRAQKHVISKMTWIVSK